MITTVLKAETGVCIALSNSCLSVSTHRDVVTAASTKLALRSSPRVLESRAVLIIRVDNKYHG